jgi:hypothetical protein
MSAKKSKPKKKRGCKTEKMNVADAKRTVQEEINKTKNLCLTNPSQSQFNSAKSKIKFRKKILKKREENLELCEKKKKKKIKTKKPKKD